MARRVAAIAIFVLAAIGAVRPIRSYDFFWHLASGRWITEHHALPLVDPFAVASDRTEWINGEWLWQVFAYTNYRAGGLTSVTWTRALVVALLFTIAYVVTRREEVDGIALVAVALAFAGAHERLDVRPSTAAAMFVVLAIAACSRRRTILYALITIVWINVHPSALLAPAIVLLLRRDLLMTLVSAAALFVNPYGWRGIAAPIELTTYVRSGSFVNAEWLPSPPLLFPLLYVTIAIAVVVFLVAENKREEMWRFALLAIFAVLAVRHVRNQGLYFAAFPLLVVPQFRRVAPQRILIVAAAAIVAMVAATSTHAIGADANRFPIRAVEALQRSPFNRGHVYNPDQFGGFLIWSFYPERRALTDGRNELYRSYNEEYARARLDSRAWQALLRKYRIDVAFDEYHPPLDTIDAVTGQHRSVPASLAYFPRQQWALIAFDDAAMVLVRRTAFAAADIQRWEWKGVTPDAR
ncbi:MAG: hypothetical protein ACXW2X_11085 [Thermoanaerobaculia bacterium]